MPPCVIFIYKNLAEKKWTVANFTLPLTTKNRKNFTYKEII